ncbi:hypothetical protein NMK50_08365 [Bartonella harrusi]|uniref:Uncharacterized protein n=2 Tax=Bartonella harrusi TaxID=2961895 RepID=A0ABY5EUU9_9HYPH|nr:hypothetical protein NMK50_08365 [Bartonella harrusi]
MRGEALLGVSSAVSIILTLVVGRLLALGSGRLRVGALSYEGCWHWVFAV